ncbi:MAG: NfeD family protein [Acidimicrobiia bacterium]
MRRRRLSTVGLLAVLAGVLLSLFTAFGPAASPAAARAEGDQPAGSTSLVEVVEVSGLFDPILVDFVEERIAEANQRGLTALVLRLNSPGAVVEDEQVVELARQIAGSPVPIAIWVGPSSAQARGAAAQLVGVARPGGIASGASVGKAGEQILPRDEFGVLFGDAANRARDAFVRFEDATTAGLVPAATLGDFIINLEGVATKSVRIDGVERREPATTVRFVQLPLSRELMHTVASPSVAYLLFVIGVGLIVFELFTAGIGVAGVVGAVFVVGGCYGLAVLPARWWAVALLLLSFPVFGADVQTGVPRRATLVGVVLFLVGTFALYRGVSLSWVTVVSAVVLLLVVYLRGMPAMVRGRFSAVDLGRDWLVGEEGTVTADVSPSGTVAVRAAQWPATTAQGSLAVGDRVTVVGTKGHVLEVSAVTE